MAVLKLLSVYYSIKKGLAPTGLSGYLNAGQTLYYLINENTSMYVPIYKRCLYTKYVSELVHTYNNLMLITKPTPFFQKINLSVWTV